MNRSTATSQWSQQALERSPDTIRLCPACAEIEGSVRAVAKADWLRPERDFGGQCRVGVSYVREGARCQQRCWDKFDVEHDPEVNRMLALPAGGNE